MTILLILIDLLAGMMNAPGMAKGNPLSWIAFFVCIGAAVYIAAMAIKRGRA